MNALFAAAADVQAFRSGQNWQCCVIGGLAVQRWGEPRQTRDVDLTLLTGVGGEERFVDPILLRYAGRIPDARRFALERRVLLVQTIDSVPIDISMGALPFEARVIERSTPYEFAAGNTAITRSAEDLVVLKAFADRPQDWLDIEGIIVRQRDRLKQPAILDELRPLLDLKEDAVPERTLLRLFAKHS